LIFISGLTRRLLETADEYRLSAWLFLKLLAVIYFVAFLSLAVQITGLVGPHGILPFGERLADIYNNFGPEAWWRLPTLFWLGSNNLSLQVAAYAGCFFSITLLLGWKQRLSLILLFVLYLSLFHAGQTFLTFQWDTLLLETGFLAIFLVDHPTRLVIFLYYWLLFRLRFLSGISKLLSNDPSWSGLTALLYYFETQPLPHVGAWYAHHLPDWVLQDGVLLVFFIEIVVPFFIFLPRRFRLFAAFSTILLQLLIIATSNHNFVNLLTILLCLLLLDDRIINRIIPHGLQQRIIDRIKQPHLAQQFLTVLFSLIIFTTGLATGYRMLSNQPLPDQLNEATRLVRFYGLGHTYHIFPTMQVERHELEVQGSMDGRNWLTYDFKYKPGPLDRRPAFIVPHQPRLDWMIWFVPGQHEENMIWMDRFMRRLWEGSPEVLDLLRSNPFPDRPPRRLRVMVYRYHFTTPDERKQTGNWWKRELLGEFPFVPPRRP